MSDNEGPPDTAESPQVGDVADGQEESPESGSESLIANTDAESNTAAPTPVATRKKNEPKQKLTLEIAASVTGVEDVQQVLDSHYFRCRLPAIVGNKSHATSNLCEWIQDDESTCRWSETFDVSVSHSTLSSFDDDPFLLLAVSSVPNKPSKVSMAQSRKPTPQESSNEDNVDGSGSQADDPSIEPDGNSEINPDNTETKIEPEGEIQDGTAGDTASHADASANQSNEEPRTEKASEVLPIPEIPSHEQLAQDKEQVMEFISMLRPFVQSTTRSVDLSPFLDSELECSVESLEIALPDGNGKVIFSLKATLSTELLSDEYREAYNPLAIILHSVRSLPGVVVEESNPAVRKYVFDNEGNYDPFHLLKKFCEPVQACFLMYRGSQKEPRLVRTCSTAQQGKRKVKWMHKSVTLANLMGKDEVAEYLEFHPIKVWLHDRNVTHESDETKESIDSWLGEFAQNLLDSTWENVKASYLSNIQHSNRKKMASKIPQRGPLETSLADLDKFWFKKSQQRMLESRVQQTHGQASFRLEELWTSSGEILEHYYTKHLPETHRKSGLAPMALDLSSSVIPIKRRIPVGGFVEKTELDVGNQERMVRQQPGGYFECGTELRLKASLASPVFHHRIITEALEQQCSEGESNQCNIRKAPFERIVFMFAYSNTEFLRTIRNATEHVNQLAVPDVSLRSYCLNDEQRDAAEAGSLDILTGFHVVDDHFRIIVIEGLAEKGIRYIRENVPRGSFNTDSCVILSDSRQLFVRRMFTAFDVDLKVIRLRDPLSELVLLPEIYDRHKVDQDCFDAVMKLSELRSADRLQVVAKNDLLPQVHMLVKLESKYGESVSLEDMNGDKAVVATNVRHSQSKLNSQVQDGKSRDLSTDPSSGDGLLPMAEGANNDALTKYPQKSDGHGKSRKASVDHKNPGYILKRNEWKPKDFLMLHQERRNQVEEAFRKRRMEREKREAEERAKYGGDIYIYSGQRLNCKSIQLDNMRAKLPKASKATYTFSKEFHSLAFSLVNEEEIAMLEKLESRRRFITPKGFVYPAPRDSIESRRDPNTELSSARVEELQVPWEEHANQPRQLERGAMRPDGLEFPDFDCIATKGHETFGGYNADGTNNPDFYRSVHLCGEGLAAEQEEARKREEEEWKSKVLVKSLRIKPHYGGRKSKPSQIDKFKDVLDGKPAKRALRIVRNVTLRNGNKAPLRPAPPTLFLSEPYHEGGTRPNSDARVEEPSKDLVRYGRPGKRNRIYRRRIAPLRDEERKAPLYHEKF